MCPVNWYSFFYFVDDKGTLRAIDEKNGEEIWKIETTGRIKTHPALKYESLTFTFAPFRFIIATPILFFGNEDGRVYAVNGKTGVELWNFDTFGSVNSPPFIDKNLVYLQAQMEDFIN